MWLIIETLDNEVVGVYETKNRTTGIDEAAELAEQRTIERDRAVRELTERGYVEGYPKYRVVVTERDGPYPRRPRLE
jgi:hypothetical protein